MEVHSHLGIPNSSQMVKPFNQLGSDHSCCSQLHTYYRMLLMLLLLLLLPLLLWGMSIK